MWHRVYYKYDIEHDSLCKAIGHTASKIHLNGAEEGGCIPGKCRSRYFSLSNTSRKSSPTRNGKEKHYKLVSGSCGKKREHRENVKGDRDANASASRPEKLRYL